MQRRRFERWIGRTAPVFVESVSERDPRVLLGHATNGMPVSFRGPGSLVGGAVDLVVEETTAYGMAGRLAEETAGSASAG